MACAKRHALDEPSLVNVKAHECGHSNWRMRVVGSVGTCFKAVECGVFHVR
jgi:hypothetical protein